MRRWFHVPARHRSRDDVHGGGGAPRRPGGDRPARVEGAGHPVGGAARRRHRARRGGGAAAGAHRPGRTWPGSSSGASATRCRSSSAASRTRRSRSARCCSRRSSPVVAERGRGAVAGGPDPSRQLGRPTRRTSTSRPCASPTCPTSSTSPSPRRRRSTTPRRSGSTTVRSSPSTTSAAARSTPPCCARTGTGS